MFLSSLRVSTMDSNFCSVLVTKSMLGSIFYYKKLELISVIILATCPYNSLKIPMKLCNWLQVVRVAILIIQDDFGQKSNLLGIRQTFCPCLLFYFQGYGGLLCFTHTWIPLISIVTNTISM